MEGLDARIREKLGKRLFSLGGPTGAGKDTVVNVLLATYPEEIVRLPRVTTREKRPEEIEGVHYFFVDLPQFSRRVRRGRYGAVDTYGGNLYSIDYQALTDHLISHEYRVIMMGGICGIQIKPVFPAMTNIHLTITAEEIRRRIEKRGDDSVKVGIYVQEAIERLLVEPPLFDRQVENHDCQLRRAMGEIAEIMGLPKRESVINTEDCPCA